MPNGGNMTGTPWAGNGSFYNQSPGNYNVPGSPTYNPGGMAPPGYQPPQGGGPTNWGTWNGSQVKPGMGQPANWNPALNGPWLANAQSAFGGGAQAQQPGGGMMPLGPMGSASGMAQRPGGFQGGPVQLGGGMPQTRPATTPNYASAYGGPGGGMRPFGPVAGSGGGGPAPWGPGYVTPNTGGMFQHGYGAYGSGGR